MTKTTKKLNLNRETLRVLNGAHLSAIVGGNVGDIAQPKDPKITVLPDTK